MNRLIVVNTYMQLINAIQLKITLFKEDYICLIITDKSNNSKSIFDKLKQLQLFEDIIFLPTTQNKQRGLAFVSLLSDIYNYALGYNFKIDVIKTKSFDEFIFHNINQIPLFIYKKLLRKSPHIIFSLLEESLLKYNNYLLENEIEEDRAFRIYKKIENILKITSFLKRIKQFYCYFPTYYNGTLKSIRIPPLSDDFRFISKKVFDIAQLNYKKKYIFFGSIADKEGKEKANEFELIKKISKILGNNNILLKLHPRDDFSKYCDLGIEIDKNSNVPWEVIQLNYDFSNHIFMTALSGSVLLINALSDNKAKIFLLNELCNCKNNRVAEIFINGINEIQRSNIKDDVLKNVYFIKNYEHLKNVLEIF